ncbi:hypothetical protein SNE40_021291 [Patella caerulea]|uniref:Lysosome-associated membrane glycoprotein 2-like transmembrane domain-containing protein n=1 Tax=Patella caerulea TaxID=87958 RepID=A0AAN8GGM1_PATCE
MTTTAVPSTSPPTPSTTPKPDNTPSQNNYTFPGNCILIRTGLILTLPYEAKDKNSTITINVPAQSQVKVTGDCNVTSDVEEISLNFFQNWTIKFMFHATNKVTETANDKRAYSLENITVNYRISTERFPNCVHPGMKRELKATNLDLFPVSSEQKSFKCSSATSIKLQDGSLMTENFQYRAFNTNTNSTNFDADGVNECAADSDSNSVVPIAVGAALAGLVVIVLIAYLIGRRRSKRAGYESV